MFQDLLTILVLATVLIADILRPIFTKSCMTKAGNGLALAIRRTSRRKGRAPLPNMKLAVCEINDIGFSNGIRFILSRTLTTTTVSFNSVAATSN